MEIVGHIRAIPHVQAPEVVLDGGVIVVVMVPRPEAHMAAEAPIQRGVLQFPVPQMPFAGYVGGVPIMDMKVSWTWVKGFL